MAATRTDPTRFLQLVDAQDLALGDEPKRDANWDEAKHEERCTRNAARKGVRAAKKRKRQQRRRGRKGRGG